MGTQYVQHGDNLTLMRLWRKTEPLENAFLIQGFEAQPSWNTQSEKTNGHALVRARPLMRQTPGGPGVGDTVTYYLNHSLEFDDEEVFGAFLEDRDNCSERGAPRAAGGNVASSNSSNSTSRGTRGRSSASSSGSTTTSNSDKNINSSSPPPDFSSPGFNFTSLLNMDSGLRVDRSFRELVWNGVGDPTNDEVVPTSTSSTSSPSAALASSSVNASDADAGVVSDNESDVEAAAISLAPLPSAGAATLMRVDATDVESDMNDAVSVTWEILDGGAGVRVTVVDTSSGRAWFGVSFPDEPCEMVPAKAVIVVGTVGCFLFCPRATKT